MTIWKALAIGVGFVGGAALFAFATFLIGGGERWWYKAIGAVILVLTIAGIAFVVGGPPA